MIFTCYRSQRGTTSVLHESERFAIPFRQVEATKWSSRCHTVMDEKRFHFCVEFSTLAIQYVPASVYKGFMSNLLMSRAYARIQMKEHSRALDDLKKVLKTNPDLSKVN